jgi:hypothetical protein
MEERVRQGVRWFGVGLVVYTVMIVGVVTLTAYLAGPLQQYTTLYVGCRLLQTPPPELLMVLIVIGAASLGVLGYWEGKTRKNQE